MPVPSHARRGVVAVVGGEASGSYIHEMYWMSGQGGAKLRGSAGCVTEAAASFKCLVRWMVMRLHCKKKNNRTIASYRADQYL